MCGRFGLLAPSEIAERFALVEQLKFDPRHNAAPTQQIPVVVEDGARSLKMMRWGYEPRWLKEKGSGGPLINARAEKVASSPTFKDAFLSRRAIVPATHFFEWGGKGREKAPYLFRLRSGEIFGIAGLWFGEGEERCFVLMTTAPNELTKPIHNRMPVILRREHEDVWLDPDQSETEALLPLLGSYPASEMEAYRVSREVNSARNDSANLLEPVA